MRPCTVAAIQLCSGPDPAANLARVGALTESALDAGADLVVLPENYAGIGPAGSRPHWGFDPGMPERSPVVEPLLALSHDTPALIVLGGVPERIAGTERTFNTALVLSAGRVVAAYRKIHRFDATLEDGSKLSESEHTEAGVRPLVVHTPLASLGLSICYDLRFPELYRKLVDDGAIALAVPAAFTLTTGKDHWHVLLRARAIEQQCYVLAAAQTGRHQLSDGTGRRQSYGHAMIVDPWGTVLAQCGEGPGVAVAEIDPDVVGGIRASLPSLQHRRL